ncbi:Lrp/AsnC family transcriptional regulator [Asticcacaulis sp. DXS10W]|uniref:Lrp/AsnC family transcriptional regulator n=1 Tax=Asticcacaulis currens TaxID=2984210 RepID=A0ABT5IDH3_9CAUL|nr:Lrp/AsnC family transcriptional regulator [Asticcacaulis currens]MDC7694237.1 Lrp/AsnC family transcriptional regulator [Asticcacaulis currens]
MELDKFDRLLLNLVQEDAGRTSDSLAEQVPLSPSAIQRRLRKLKDGGIIQREIAVLDPRKADRPVIFIVGLEVERERPELLAELRRWLSKEEQVQQAYYVTGETDFVVVIASPDTTSYDELMTRLVEDNPNVKRFTTNVALSVVKRGLTLRMAEDDG